jgi:plastocyanin
MVVGTQGNRSYVPNPVPVASTGQVVFRNTDSVAHRIVMDNGSIDFGNLAPGASSQARAVSSGSFHCTIHPSMVGSFNTATAPEPPPGSGDGY